MPPWFKNVVLSILVLTLAACDALQPSSKTSTDDIQYFGRYALTQTGDYRMGWPGSGFGLRFRGTKLAVTITDDGNGIMDAVINGKSSALVLRPGTQDYTIVTSAKPSLFDVTLTRRTEVFDTALFEINDIRVDGDLVVRDLPKRKILFIGDSITAGFGVRGNTKDCQYSPASNAPLKSYAWLAATALKAETQLIAISGRGVVYNYDNNSAPVMPMQIDYALPDNAATLWDHKKFQADVVVVSLGTNDWSTVDPGQDKFNAGYTALLKDIRARFPDAHIVAASGPLLGGAQSDAVVRGINYALGELKDSNVSAVNLSLSETQLKWSCNSHPGRDSMVKMANDLAAHVGGIKGWTAKPIALPNDLRVSPPESMKVDGKKHYKKRIKEIAQLPPLDGGVMFLGDSITEGADWAALFPTIATANHGIGWDIIAGVGSRLPQIIIHNPDKIFIMIGTNDIGYDHDPLDMAAELEDVIKILKFRRPNAQLYLQSILPREAENLEKVEAINRAYEKLANETSVPFIDLTTQFIAADGSLSSDYTDDKLHLNAAGYQLWADIIRGDVLQD